MNSSASNTWIAVVLCMMVWFGYTTWFAPPPPKPAATSTTTMTAQPGATTPPAQSSNSLSALPQIKPAETFSVPAGKLSLTFSGAGGKISDADVLAYRQTAKKDSPPIRVVDSTTNGPSLSTIFTDPALRGFADAAYRSVKEGGDSKIIYQAEGATGIRVTKKYEWNPDSYLISASYHITFADASRRDWGSVLLPLGTTKLDYDAAAPLRHWETVFHQNDSVTRKTADAIDAGQKTFQGTSNWAAYANRYFATAVINASQLNPDVVTVKEADFTGIWLRYPVILKEGQKDYELKVQYFLGPKDHDELAKAGTLTGLTDYGMFKILAPPFLMLMKFFYRFSHNYGIAIILLTLFVRMALYPLALKSYRAMKEMQKIQPQIQALKEKCGDDKEKFNREQLALFKTHKINPLGGCLPLLFQMPVFFGLYGVLANAMELFHAPFFGWIQDLSVPDPFYVFPVLVGITMFIQQKITPTPGMDPIQQKMMMLMPLIIVIPTLSLPAGLAVYWFASSLIGILQQWVMTREARQQASAAKVISAPEKSSS